MNALDSQIAIARNEIEAEVRHQTFLKSHESQLDAKSFQRAWNESEYRMSYQTKRLRRLERAKLNRGE